MLKYIGGGSFVMGIPAKNLTKEQVKEYGKKYLLGLKPPLYREVKTESGELSEKTNKETDNADNKSGA